MCQPKSPYQPIFGMTGQKRAKQTRMEQNLDGV